MKLWYNLYGTYYYFEVYTVTAFCSIFYLRFDPKISKQGIPKYCGCTIVRSECRLTQKSQIRYKQRRNPIFAQNPEYYGGWKEQVYVLNKCNVLANIKYIRK